MGFVSKQGLENLPKYKSSETIDNSLLYKHVVSPVCNVLVNYLPLWLAPNLITVLGLLCNVVGYVLAVTFIDIGTDDYPLLRNISFLNGGLIFSNMMLDNMDGKQARRTKTSSPLGELVDHGCDSLCVVMGTVMTGLIIGVSGEVILIFFALCAISFYLAHWEEYFTHSLVLPALNGPIEAQVALSLIHLLTFFVGRTWWSETLFVIFGYDMSMKRVLMVLFFVGSSYTTLQSIICGSIKAKKMGIPISFALSQLFPLATCYAAGGLWVFSNYTQFTEHSVLFVTIFGILFSFIVIRCIVERICNEPFRLFYTIMIPLLLAAANAATRFLHREPLLPEYEVLWGMFVCVLGAWLYLAVSLLDQMCGKLKISPFTIPKIKMPTSQTT